MSTNDKKNSKQKKQVSTPENETEVLNETTPVEETYVEDVVILPSPEEALTLSLKEEKDRNLRLMADYDNFRRRSIKEKDAIYPDAVAATVKELLPVLDNFKRAMETSCSDEEYAKGIQMIYTQYLDSLKKLGLEEFGATGETFDAKFHNAVMHCEDDTLGQNVISQVFASGYKIGDRVLRYAMVQTAN